MSLWPSQAALQNCVAFQNAKPTHNGLDSFPRKEQDTVQAIEIVAGAQGEKKDGTDPSASDRYCHWWIVSAVEAKVPGWRMT